MNAVYTKTAKYYLNMIISIFDSHFPTSSCLLQSMHLLLCCVLFSWKCKPTF